MPYLLDTNVAVRRILPSDPQHQTVTEAIDTLRQQGEILYITAQIIVEFYALATRPIEANGLGMPTALASLEASKLEAIFPLLPEVPSIFSLWRKTVDTYHVIGRQVYDARLVAVMQAHNITHLLTMNSTHFRRITSITVVEPKDVIGTIPSQV